MALSNLKAVIELNDLNTSDQFFVMCRESPAVGCTNDFFTVYDIANVFSETSSFVCYLTFKN